MLTINELKDYFKLENSHAKKELGQNFLVNQKIVDQIIGLLEINKDDNILEIGPGLGSLTENIIGKPNKFVAVEYDAKFVKFLEMSFKDKDFEIVKDNILKYRTFEANKLIGNLPYYITTDILEYVTTRFVNMDFGVFMVQKECLKRLLNIKGKDNSALNVYLSYLFDIENKIKVSKDCFFPIPSVDSVVFKITTKKDKDRKFALVLFKVCKVCFLNRRKTIFNNILSIVKDKELAKSILENSKIDLNARAESLEIESYINLTNLLLNNGILKL